MHRHTILATSVAASFLALVSITVLSCESPSGGERASASDSSGGDAGASSNSSAAAASGTKAVTKPDAPTKDAPRVQGKADANEITITPFLPSERCAVCHSHSPRAQALTTANGDDASPFGTWQATAMANSFRDPYWRAQMSREVELAPGNKAAIESLCLNCHAPIASHTARLTNTPPPSIETAVPDPLAQEGVSCTVCHRTTDEGLGTPASFNGRLAIRGDARIYGPFAEPATGPMRMHTGFTPTHGAHVSTSALCGACHTLYTQAEGATEPFLEQAVYLEWRNSEFSDENGVTSESRTCQACHMPDVGSMRIARNPGGVDFNIKVRDDVRSHTFVGGNAFLIDLLRENAKELGVTATSAALERVAAAARAMLAHDTARLSISNVVRTADRLEFDVRVENLTGHKLPSGYPARRVWLDVDVRAGRTKLWESGYTDASGRLKGIADEFAIPHYDRIERPDQVAVYEMVSGDVAGKTTTNLTRMATRSKDTRLLPRGWRADGPHANETAPVGTQGDDDFVAGSDTVTYSVPIPADAKDLLVVAGLYYQPIPPAWAATLESSKTEESRRFLTMYAKADHTPDSIATATVQVPAK